MSSSYSVTETKAFTITHARYLASKVATDLKRLQRLYGKPSDASIADYEGEITELLRNGYLERVTYGFRRNGNWIEPALRYTARGLIGDGVDDDPGKIRPSMDVSNATFYSFLTYSAAWFDLSEAHQETFKKTLPLQRGSANEPQVEGGYFADDKNYSAGGRALGRSSVRSF